MAHIRWGPAACSFLVTRDISSRDDPYVGCMHPSVVAGLSTVSALVGEAGPQHGWLRGHTLFGGCKLAGGQGRLPMHLGCCQPTVSGARSLHRCLPNVGYSELVQACGRGEVPARGSLHSPKELRTGAGPLVGRAGSLLL